jgi:drug/metabolite transporter (DMT)-like permease
MAAGSTLKAILVNLAGIFLLDLMGVIIKFLGPAYGAAELAFYRNIFAMIPSFLVLWLSADWQASGRSYRIRQWPLAWVRGAFVSLAQFMFYLSLVRLEFATASTIGFSMSLFITAFAVPLLGEKVGAIRWISVVIGFAGVVMVMGPGSDAFTWDALLPVGAAIFYALTSVTSRLFDDEVPTPLMNLYSNATAIAGAVLLCVVGGGFSPLGSMAEMGLIMVMGTLGGIGVLLLMVSFRMAEPSSLSPFNYFGIPFAIGLGWLFFGEAPFDRLFPGVLLIIGSGLMIVWRERRLRKQALAALAKIETAT